MIVFAIPIFEKKKKKKKNNNLSLIVSAIEIVLQPEKNYVSRNNRLTMYYFISLWRDTFISLRCATRDNNNN